MIALCACRKTLPYRSDPSFVSWTSHDRLWPIRSRSCSCRELHSHMLALESRRTLLSQRSNSTPMARESFYGLLGLSIWACQMYFTYIVVIRFLNPHSPSILVIPLQVTFQVLDLKSTVCKRFWICTFHTPEDTLAWSETSHLNNFIFPYWLPRMIWSRTREQKIFGSST